VNAPREPRADPRAARPLPPPAAARAFLDDLVRRHLLEAAAAADFLNRHADRLADFADVGLLGPALVGAGLLTDYQLGRIRAGNAHGLVLGGYRVLDRFGGGSVSIVFLGEHILLRRRVAIKVMPVGDDFPPALLERFYAEMRLLAELRHPHVVLALDAGRLPPPAPKEAALHYLVMELVPGGDLEHYVYDHGRVPVAQACEWARQAASGLQEAHDLHLIHRDLKPSNLLLDKEGLVKVMDFGLARRFGSKLTNPGDVLGSVEFMAPEQSVDPSAVGPPADVYGLGATLFWLLTGETPYPAEPSVAKALRALQRERPRRLRQFLGDAPEPLEQLVEQMLARDPRLRPATPLAVMHALARFTGPVAPPWEIDLGPDAALPTLPATEPVWRVLVADGSALVRQHVRTTLEALGCQCADAETGPAALRLLQERPFDLALLGVSLPDVDGYEVCRRLRDRPPRPHLKVILLGDEAEANLLAEAVLEGADDFVPRPIDPTQFAAKVQHMMRLKDAQDRADLLARHLLAVNRQLEHSLKARAHDVVQAQDALLFAMAKMAESRAGETAGHQRRLQQYVAALADRLRREPAWAKVLTVSFLELLERCTPLHDVGKVGLPDQVLAKPGPLDPAERRLVEAHPALGSEMLEAIGRSYGESFSFLGMARAIVRHHHERFDGAGYPDRLAGEEIPPAARLVSVADAYDALRRKQPYRPALSHAQAVRCLLHDSEGAFDPRVLRAFEQCQERFERIFLEVIS
jgi:response regulator RpfG family c-di-GMP phosphodiesterase